jgi:Rrf2 family protein
MKFSSQEEYGIRCLLEVVRGGLDGSVTIPEISRREGLTEPYVAKLLMILRKGGLINSTRGHSGGYTLARPAEDIRVGEVLALLGGRLYEDDFCDRHVGVQETCSHAKGCSIKSLWGRVQEAVDAVVNNITLADIVREQAEGDLIQIQANAEAYRSASEVHA